MYLPARFSRAGRSSEDAAAQTGNSPFVLGIVPKAGWGGGQEPRQPESPAATRSSPVSVAAGGRLDSKEGGNVTFERPQKEAAAEIRARPGARYVLSLRGTARPARPAHGTPRCTRHSAGSRGLRSQHPVVNVLSSAAGRAAKSRLGIREARHCPVRHYPGSGQRAQGFFRPTWHHLPAPVR